MIKGFGIKKYIKLFGFILGFFLFFGYSVYAYENVTCNYIIYGDHNQATGNCIKVNNGDSITLGSTRYYFNGGAISSVYSGTTYGGIFTPNFNEYTNYSQLIRNIYVNGEFKTLGLQQVNNITYTSGFNNLVCISSGYNDCMRTNNGFNTIYYYQNISEFVGQSYDYVITPYGSISSTRPSTYGFCFHFPTLNKYLCLPASVGTFVYLQDTGYNITSADFYSTNSSRFPFSGSYNGDSESEIGVGGIELGSDYSAINYYERTYSWDKSICYAGINSLSYLYGQNGVSFHKGQGLSIFDVYSGIYGNSDINNVYVWLNTQLFNYENWFDVWGKVGSVGNPSWLGDYNSGTNQMDLYYNNLTFPFANKPVAFYFLADNITNNSPYSTMGSSVVSYCNLKINSGSFNDIIDQSDKNNINNYTEQSNTNIGLNPDGTEKDYTGYWVGSGVDLAFSGNTSIKNTLKNFFDEFDKGLSIIDVNTNNRILPTWIVSAFIFVVLFKFLRKK